MTVLALLIAALMPKFGFRYIGTLFAIVVPSLIVVLADLDVSLVRDVGDIGGAFPELVAPNLFDMSFELVTGAVAIARRRPLDG